MKHSWKLRVAVLLTTVGAALGAALLLASPAPLPSPWKPPLGLPEPPFGIKESGPPAPKPWTTETPGFYCIDATNPQASDNRAYGTPAAPRRSIPRPVPAGSVVEIRGKYNIAHQNPRGLVFQGTAASPVFIRGASATEKPVVTRAWEVSGTYFIMENLEFAFEDGVNGALGFLGPVNNAALRHSDVHGNPYGGGVKLTNDRVAEVANVTLFHNIIHDNGDWKTRQDQDVHGIRVGFAVHHVWVVDNEMMRNSGDGIQINAARFQASTHHIFVGRNVAHHNKQNGFWTKQAVDVVFSENLAYAHRPSPSSFGAGLGFQYAPERVWFLFNHVHDSEYGIGSGSDSGMGSGVSSYFIGNVLHNLHHMTPYNPETGSSQAAIMLRGGVQRYIVNNTIYDVDAGIVTPSTTGALHIINNIIGKITEPRGTHIFIEQKPVVSASVMRNNLFDQNVRIRLASDRGGLDKGQCKGCETGAPQFLAPGTDDFRIGPTSPAVDRGSSDDVYAAYEKLYGVSIAVDAAGTKRPQGRAFDIGAYESGSAPPARRESGTAQR